MWVLRCLGQRRIKLWEKQQNQNCWILRLVASHPSPSNQFCSKFPFGSEWLSSQCLPLPSPGHWLLHFALPSLAQLSDCVAPGKENKPILLRWSTWSKKSQQSQIFHSNMRFNERAQTVLPWMKTRSVTSVLLLSVFCSCSAPHGPGPRLQAPAGMWTSPSLRWLAPASRKGKRD